MSQLPNLEQRTSGILLHITSLPGSPYSGDLGDAAHAFLDTLKVSRQSWWQMLPINPVGDGDSPYSTVSCLAGEPLLIAAKPLVAEGWLTRVPRAPKGSAERRANYAASRRWRRAWLQEAYEGFLTQATREQRQAFQQYNKSHDQWLHDFALFQVISSQHGKDWSLWPKPLRDRDPAALRQVATQQAAALGFQKFLQFAFDRQWRSLRQAAAARGIGLIGDAPIFVSLGSADVWANQSQFLLNAQKRPTHVAGVPPDYFNRDGQLWGNALYDWDEMRRTRFRWWIQRMQRMTEWFDIIRIDHFIGFHRYWAIPATAKTAKTGKWRLAPGHALFAAMRHAMGSLPFIAEDLGLVTQEVWDLRDAFHLPGMRVLQFGFGNDQGSAYHRAHEFTKNCVVYTGTHDNDTTLGWYRSARRQRSVKKPSFDWQRVAAIVGEREPQAVQNLMEVGFQSVSNTIIVPAQDILTLDGKHRMNVPGTARGNWQWRLLGTDWKLSHSRYLAQISRATDRCGNVN